MHECSGKQGKYEVLDGVVCEVDMLGIYRVCVRPGL